MSTPRVLLVVVLVALLANPPLLLSSAANPSPLPSSTADPLLLSLSSAGDPPPPCFCPAANPPPPCICPRSAANPPPPCMCPTSPPWTQNVDLTGRKNISGNLEFLEELKLSNEKFLNDFQQLKNQQWTPPATESVFPKILLALLMIFELVAGGVLIFGSEAFRLRTKKAIIIFGMILLAFTAPMWYIWDDNNYIQTMPFIVSVMSKLIVTIISPIEGPRGRLHQSPPSTPLSTPPTSTGTPTASGILATLMTSVTSSVCQHLSSVRRHLTQPPCRRRLPPVPCQHR